MRSRCALVVLVVGAWLSTASIAAASVDPGVGGGLPDANLGVLNEGARTLNFDDGWRFKLVNTSDTTDPSGTYGDSSDPKAAAPGFDDSGWQPVTLPHDWSITQLPRVDQTNATGYFPGGLGWYRKAFTLPTWMTGKTISVDFDGVFDNSYVYLNGQPLGNHPYGYTGYSFDISKLVHTDGRTPNVLAVVVQNKEPSSRWYSGSGITRHVHLTVTDPIHVARWGTFVTTPGLATTIKSGYATVHVATQLANGSGSAATAGVQYTIRDARGHTVAHGGSTGVSLPSDGATDTTDIRVEDPRLWSTTDPYLYTLETRLVVGHRIVDSTSTTFGIRWLVFDSNGGVFLNGRHLKLQGVNLHNDEGALGSVDNYDALYRQMSIMKRMGVNAFRTSHNPPSPEMVDVCQRLGIVMMVEAFDAWDRQKLSQDYHLYFAQWSDYDIKEMVNESKNSPAVIMWSIGNEIPDWTSAQALPIEQRLIGDIRSIDTTRPVVAGSDRYRSVPKPGSVADQMLQNLDGLGVNYDTAQAIDGLHAQYPTKFFFASESSSETSTRGYYQDPDLVNTGQTFTPGSREVSSYDNNLETWTLSGDYSLRIDRDRPFFGGQFLWSGFDYIGEPTPYNIFPVKTSFFGATDTAGFPKDQYYLFKSQWNPSPMVHIVPMNWTDHQPGEPVQVWAYANEPTVELFLNGRSLGARTFDASGPLHVSWTVPFEPGQLVAVARDAAGRAVARDVVQTAGAPYALTLTPDRTVLRDDGKSLSYVTVHVVDRHGVEVPDADNTIAIDVSGAGSFAGADNGKEDDGEGYTEPTHDAFNGKLLAIVESSTQPGPITITAAADGLRAAAYGLYSSSRSTSGLARSGARLTGPMPAGAVQAPAAAAGPTQPTADASFTGAVSSTGSDFASSATLPAAMLDGNATTFWSNRYRKDATQTLPVITNARRGDWVSVTWGSPQSVDEIDASFIVDANDQLPADVVVSYWDGAGWVPVSGRHVTFASASNAPSTITFDPVTTTKLKLDMTSASPRDPTTGNLAISELRIPGVT